LLAGINSLLSAATLLHSDAPLLISGADGVRADAGDLLTASAVLHFAALQWSVFGRQQHQAHSGVRGPHLYSRWWLTCAQKSPEP
jgi:hypothetical protein